MVENIKQENKQTKNQEQLGESNRTDPKVCHDPSFTFEGIARLFPNQNKELGEDGEISAYNEYDMTKIDGIEYPLVTINNRNIENHEIVNMNISYNDFLPTISITIFDEHEEEQKINTTQMSSIIRVVMVSPVDKVYKKILLNFRILNASIDPSNTLYCYPPNSPCCCPLTPNPLIILFKELKLKMNNNNITMNDVIDTI